MTTTSWISAPAVSAGRWLGPDMVFAFGGRRGQARLGEPLHQSTRRPGPRHAYRGGVREIATGVWHWRGGPPEWTPGQTWERMVSCYAIDTGADLLLFDPVDVPAELRERASAVMLTCPW